MGEIGEFEKCKQRQQREEKFDFSSFSPQFSNFTVVICILSEVIKNE